MQTPGGRMLKEDLASVAFVVKQVVAMRTAINMQTSVDLDIFSRAFTAEEHAELFMRCMDNWAVPYVRTVKDATDLLAARPEADAHKCPSQGTYAWFLETSDAVGGPHAQVFYDGMTSEQTIAGRSKQHEDNFDEFKAALKSPEKYDVMTVRNTMPLLYGDFVHDSECWSEGLLFLDSTDPLSLLCAHREGPRHDVRSARRRKGNGKVARRRGAKGCAKERSQPQGPGLAMG